MSRLRPAAAPLTAMGYLLAAMGGALLNGLPVVTSALTGSGVPAGALPLIGWAEILLGVASLLLATRARSAGHGGWATWVPTPLRSIPRSRMDVVAFLLNRAGLAFLLRWAVGGILFWAALPVMGLAQARSDGEADVRSRLHHVLLYLFFFGFGVGGLWNFVGHVFMSDLVAASAGWAPGSPFQAELGFFNLGSGMVGLLCLWWRDRFWIAAGLAPSVFVWGAAFVHVRDHLATGNDAPANWSVAAVGANVVIPAVVLVLLLSYARRGGFAAGAD